MNNKVILTDCDGVLLDWLHSFTEWMVNLGYKVTDEGKDEYQIHKRFGIDRTQGRNLVRAFNESASIAFLTPHLDAIKYVRKLHEEHGYVFHVITSQTKNPHAQELRKQNLRRIFGDTVFEKFIILDTGWDKDTALKKYKDSECFWIEDKPENVDLGHKLGLRGVLMSHDHNKDYAHDEVSVANNWKDVYNIITGE